MKNNNTNMNYKSNLKNNIDLSKNKLNELVIKDFIIVVDTREQLPYSFSKYSYTITKSKLDQGDYSIQGLESIIAVERKSKEDIYGCIGTGRIRFENELNRLTTIKRACVVIESSIMDFVNNPPSYTKVNPISAFRSCASWWVKYNIPFFFCDNREIAENVTRNFLELSFKHQMDLVECDNDLNGNKIINSNKIYVEI